MLDPLQFVRPVFVNVRMAARSGRPKAVGGQSRMYVVAPDPHQSASGPWRLHIHDGSERRIHDPPLKCSDSSRRPTSILKTAFFKKALNLEVFFWNVSALIAVATGHCLNAVIRAGATLVGPSDFQNFFLGPLRAPEEAPGRGKSSELAPSVGERHAAQDHCIFAMDYVAPCPPTL